MTELKLKEGERTPGLPLWLLERSGMGYDEAFGFVVAARNEERARQVAASHAGAEGGDVWRKRRRSTCVKIAREGRWRREREIIRDFNAG
jgi:hypothetical protein